MKKENQIEEKKTFSEKMAEKKQQAKDRYETFQLVLSFIGAFFFALSTFLSTKQYSDTKLYPFILGFVIAYVVVFAIFLIIHRSSSKDVKSDTKKFKSVFNIIKLLLNLLFLGSSLLIFIQSLNNIGTGIIAIIQVTISGLLLVLKIFSTIRKIFKSIKKMKKDKQKELQKKEKEENK